MNCIINLDSWTAGTINTNAPVIRKIVKEVPHMKKIVSLVLAMMLALGCVSFAAAEVTDLLDYQTTPNEMETFCYQYSQNAKELNVLTNCYDHLLTNDPNGTLIPNIAHTWYADESGLVWTFELNKGVTWVDYQGNYKADCVAEDFATGLEWVLNAHKNQAANTSMPIQMIVGASEYYEYTKNLSEEEGKALKLDKFYEMVGVEVPDDYTIKFTTLDVMSYFPTLACYNCLAPLSAKLIEEIGVDGYFGATNETIWYNGPYTITYYVHQNEKILTKNESYWNKDNVKLFDTVTVKMVEDINRAFDLFMAGELHYVELNESQITLINNDPSHEFSGCLVPTLPDKYSRTWHWNYVKLNADGTPDTNWNTAIANEAFRKAIYYGLDLTNYLARTNVIDPLSCQNYAYTMSNLVAKSDGTEYTAMVLDKLGLAYANDHYSRVDAEKFAAYKQQAMEELSAKGVTFPVVCDWYISGSSATAKDTADVLAQMFSDYLGDDFIVLRTCTYTSAYNPEVIVPQLQSVWSSGWGADFADPVNFLGQEIDNDDNAYYALNYSNVDQITDPELKETFKVFTDMVNAAHAITNDNDARYEAFAEAEAYYIEKVLCLPTYYNKTIQLTQINDYTKINSLYGTQSERYVNWEVSDTVYTAEEYANLK